MTLGPLELLLMLIPLAIYIGLIAGVIYLIVQVARNSNDIKQNSQAIAQLREAQKTAPPLGRGRILKCLVRRLFRIYHLREVLAEFLEPLIKGAQVFHEATHDVYGQRKNDGGVLVRAELQHRL